MPLDYRELVLYMKALKTFFHKEYDADFSVGKLNQSSPDFTYFSLTPNDFKKEKLKFVIILNHKNMSFEICLSGRNKSIRKKYWEIFKDSDWDKYHISDSIDDSLMIIDHTIVPHPDFTERIQLTKQIEQASLNFINDLRECLMLGFF